MNNSKIMLEKILQYIQIKGITEKECLKSCKINTSFLTDWKNEKIKNPSVDKIIKLAIFLDIDLYELLLGIDKSPSGLSESEKNLLDVFNSLSNEDKIRVSERANALAELAAERAAQETEKSKLPTDIKFVPGADEAPEQDEEKPLIEIRHSVYKVSAGRGFELEEGDSWETIEIPDTPEARRADYALTISGDSMEPVYYDGDIVLVKAQDTVEMGQIGIFILDGSGYIKKYYGDYLVSLNEDYDDIPLSGYEDVRCSGRVIGRV